jgi:fatty-acyl-CoA synthase
MICYWDEPQKTAEAFENGWYKTGDLGTIDEDGYLKIDGRTKEMIIRGGENVYPREVEEVIQTHPEVLEAAVCGIPDEKMGEEIVSWIKLKDPMKKSTLKAQDLKLFLKDKISYFKIPKHVLVMDSFPMTASGKVQKHIMSQKSCHILGIDH